MNLRFHQYSYILWITLAVLGLCISPTPAKAAAERQEIDCTKLPPVNWQEKQTNVFAFIYPDEYEEMLTDLFSRYGTKLDDEYASFARLFETSLSLPVSIRVYPSITNYICLNIVASPVAVEESHSRIGMREIALFGDRIRANTTQWESEALNILRFELGILFVNQITDSKAPPGILGGVGFYMMDPYDIFEEHDITDAGIGKPEDTWRTLWDNETSLTLPGKRLQAVSTIAYLIDAYGWPTFLQFLKDLRTSESYRQSLNDAYGVEFSDLQDEWSRYYPLYYQGRWRAHILYDFDLTPYHEMVAGGAYTDTVLGLKDVITFLEQSGQQEKLKEANALLEQAKLGQEASALVVQSRQALQQGRYEESITLADQAQSIFDQLGDTRRIAELDSYRAWAGEVSSLQSEMNQLMQDYTGNGRSSETLEKMIPISQRLAELGENQAQSSMQSILQQEEALQKSQRVQGYSIVALVVTILIVIRLILVPFRPPVEKI